MTDAEASSANMGGGGSANASGRAIVRNVALNYANLARATVVGLLVTPLLLRALGESAFGVWSLVLGATAYIALVDSGIATALIARVAAAEAQEDFTQLATVLRSGALLLSAVTTVGAAVLAILAMAFDHIFDVPAALEGPARAALVIVGVSTLLTVAGASWTAALVGIGRVDLISILGFATSTVLAAGQVALALLGVGLAGLALCSLIVTVVSLAITRAISRRQLRDLPRSRASWRTATSILSLGARNSLVGVTVLVAFGSDVLVVGAIAGPIAAASYSVAARAAGFARTIAVSVNDVLVPAFGYAAARGDMARARILIQSALFASLFIAIPLMTPLAIFSQPLLSLWLGDPPSGSAAILSLLCVFTVLQIPGTLIYVYLTGAQRSKDLLRFSVPTAVLNLGLSLAFTVWLGVIGPAIGSIIATLIIDPLLLRYVAHSVIKRRTRDMFSLVRSTLMVPSLGAVAVALVLRPVVADRPLGGLLAAAGTALLFFALAGLTLRRNESTELAPAVRAIPRIGPRLERLLVNNAGASATD